MQPSKTVQVTFRLTSSEAALLDKIMNGRKSESRAVLARAIILDGLDDDDRAHGGPGLPRDLTGIEQAARNCGAC